VPWVSLRTRMEVFFLRGKVRDVRCCLTRTTASDLSKGSKQSIMRELQKRALLPPLPPACRRRRSSSLTWAKPR
jgi:hypothetical protein